MSAATARRITTDMNMVTMTSTPRQQTEARKLSAVAAAAPGYAADGTVRRNAPKQRETLPRVLGQVTSRLSTLLRTAEA